MIVHVEKLVKRYNDLIALDHFNLDVKEGEILGLLGPNGSGKTTAINCILSLLTYDKGTIEIFGQKMHANAYDIKQDIGLVMQNVAVFDELTVEENIDYFCGLYIKNKAKRKVLVAEAIDFVELNEFKKFRPKKLSGGLLRRLNIACGIAHKPKLIFMDEPTVAVDPQSRNSILNGIKRLNADGATIIYTSHYMEEIEELCSQIVIMDKGKQVAIGTKEQLKSMISLKEKIEIDQVILDKSHLSHLKEIANVIEVQYINEHLEIKCNGGSHNLVNILDYLKEEGITFGMIYSKLPTLNDVFLEITGKDLRD